MLKFYLLLCLLVFFLCDISACRHETHILHFNFTGLYAYSPLQLYRTLRIYSTSTLPDFTHILHYNFTGLHAYSPLQLYRILRIFSTSTLPDFTRILHFNFTGLYAYSLLQLYRTSTLQGVCLNVFSFFSHFLTLLIRRLDFDGTDVPKCFFLLF